jgi:hypothetical protein
MPATAPRSNGDLGKALDVARAAWGECAARVDVIADCQAKALAAPLADHQGDAHE